MNFVDGIKKYFINEFILVLVIPFVVVLVYGFIAKAYLNYASADDSEIIASSDIR